MAKARENPKVLFKVELSQDDIAHMMDDPEAKSRVLDQIKWQLDNSPKIAEHKQYVIDMKKARMLWNELQDGNAVIANMERTIMYYRYYTAIKIRQLQRDFQQYTDGYMNQILAEQKSSVRYIGGNLDSVHRAELPDRTKDKIYHLSSVYQQYHHTSYVVQDETEPTLCGEKTERYHVISNNIQYMYACGTICPKCIEAVEKYIKAHHVIK